MKCKTACDCCNLPKGTCGICKRTDVLLFKRGPHGVSNASGSTLLTYHDNPENIACPNGGNVAEEFKNIL